MFVCHKVKHILGVNTTVLHYSSYYDFHTNISWIVMIYLKHYSLDFRLSRPMSYMIKSPQFSVILCPHVKNGIVIKTSSWAKSLSDYQTDSLGSVVKL